jgi:hypothetical protein
MLRSAAYDMIERVRDELSAARFSMSIVADNWEEHFPATSRLPNELSLTDVKRALDNSELTYILRLFSTFEAILRDFWSHGMGRKTDPDLRPLMDSVAARRHVDAITLADAHAIRVYRNRIMHRNESLLEVDFPQASHALGKYLSWLPDRW